MLIQSPYRLGLPFLLLTGTILTIFLYPTAATAQECVALASVMGREIERIGDQDQISIQKKANLCSSKYQTASAEQRAKIEAAYGLFTGGASGSTTQIQQMQEAIAVGMPIAGHPPHGSGRAQFEHPAPTLGV